MIDIHERILGLIQQQSKIYVPTLPKVDGITYRMRSCDETLDTSGMHEGYAIRICDILISDVVIDTIMFYKHPYDKGKSLVLERRRVKPTEEELKRIVERCEKKAKSKLSKKQILREFKAIEDIRKSFEEVNSKDYGSCWRDSEEESCYKLDLGVDNKHKKVLLISIGKMDKEAMLADAGMSRTKFYEKHKDIRSVYIYSSQLEVRYYDKKTVRVARKLVSNILPSSVRNAIKNCLSNG